MAQSSGTINLDWMTTFAQQKGVKIALSEYGAGSPGSKGEGSGRGARRRHVDRGVDRSG